MNRGDWIPITRAARILKCSPTTLSRWCQCGDLRFEWWSNGKRRRIQVGDLVDLVVERGGDLPAELAPLAIQQVGSERVELEIRFHRQRLQALLAERDRRIRVNIWNKVTTSAAS